jgi:hypothetical protein
MIKQLELLELKINDYRAWASYELKQASLSLGMTALSSFVLGLGIEGLSRGDLTGLVAIGVGGVATAGSGYLAKSELGDYFEFRATASGLENQMTALSADPEV